MLDKIRDIICNYTTLERSLILPESSIRDLGLNSYDFMNIIAQCEQVFSIVIEDRDIHTLETVDDIVKYLEKAVK